MKTCLIRYRDGTEKIIEAELINTNGCLELILESDSMGYRARSIFIPLDLVAEVVFPK